VHLNSCFCSEVAEPCSRVSPGTTFTTFWPALPPGSPVLFHLPVLAWVVVKVAVARNGRTRTRVSAPESQTRVPRFHPATTLVSLLAQPTIWVPTWALLPGPGPGRWPRWRLPETVETGTRVSAPESQNRVPRVSPCNHPGLPPGPAYLLGPQPGLSCLVLAWGGGQGGGCPKRSKPELVFLLRSRRTRVPRVSPCNHPWPPSWPTLPSGSQPGLSCPVLDLGWCPRWRLPETVETGNSCFCSRVAGPCSACFTLGPPLTTLLASLPPGPQPGLSCLGPGPGWCPRWRLPGTVETGNSCFCSGVAEPCSACSPWDHHWPPPGPAYPLGPHPGLSCLGPDLGLQVGSSGVVPDRIERSLFSASQLPRPPPGESCCAACAGLRPCCRLLRRRRLESVLALLLAFSESQIRVGV